MMTDQMKAWIDGASYEALLRRWRNAPGGSPWFQGEVGDYYKQVMAQRMTEIHPSEHVAASKRIGWRGGEEE